MEARINAIAKAADDLNNHPPKPDPTGYWDIWNPEKQEYELSDIPVSNVSPISYDIISGGGAAID